MLISIVTPSLNQKAFLPHAIESVLRQDYPELEYLVVDGGSTDGSVDLLRSYDSRLRWISEPDTGQSDAINKGFRMARGEVVAWINADDVLLAGAVNKAAAAFAADPDLGMVYGEGYMIDEQGEIKCRFPHTEPFNLWRLIHYGDTILQQTVFMRKAAVEQVGYLDESLHYGMDWDLFICLGKRFRVQYLNEYMGCIREHSSTKTSTGGHRRFRELARIIRRHAGRRFAPSFFGYGLATYTSVLSGYLSQWFPPVFLPLTLRALRPVHAAAGHFIGRYMEDTQGWHPDGWAAPLVHFLFPNHNGAAALQVEGVVPQLSAQPPRQTLSVVLNGRRLRQMELPLGPFRLVEPLPDWAARADVLRVDLAASRDLCRKANPGSLWPRRLCYQLRKVEIVSL